MTIICEICSGATAGFKIIVLNFELQASRIIHIFSNPVSYEFAITCALEKAAVKNVAYCDRVDCMSGVSHRRLIFTVPFSTVKYCPRVCSTAAE